MRLDIYHHFTPAFESLVMRFFEASCFSIDQEMIMSALTDLQDAVAAEKAVVDSAIVLLNGLKAKLDEAIAANDPAALQALSADLGAQTAALAAAVAADTPAA